MPYVTFDMPVDEKEEILGQAVQKAIKRLHDKGIPSVHGDEKGVYELYPDGTKKYIKLYEDGEEPEIFTIIKNQKQNINV